MTDDDQDGWPETFSARAVAAVLAILPALGANRSGMQEILDTHMKALPQMGFPQEEMQEVSALHKGIRAMLEIRKAGIYDPPIGSSH